MKNFYSFFFSIVFPFLLYAQDLTIEGTVTVQADGLLYVEGNVEIKPTGTLDIKSSGSQRGKVKVKPNALTGTWVCNGTTTGTGEVQFLGANIDYTVSGSNVAFPHLILDFGQVVGGEIDNAMTLNANTEITQSLTLKKGKIITAAGKEIYVSNTAGNAILGQNSGSSYTNFGTEKSRYIEGTLRRAITTGADNYYLFPIGSANRGYNAASVDLRTSVANAVIPSGVTSLIAKFKEIDNPGNIAVQYTTSGDCYFTTAQQYLEFYWMVKKYGYWDIKPNDTTKATGWMYDFYCFPDIDYLTNPSGDNPGLTHLKIIKAPSTAPLPSSSMNWSPYFFQSGNPCNGVNVDGNTFEWFPGEFQAAAATDSIAAWDLTTFSRFGLAGGTGAGLPIELLYLQAYPVNNKYIQVEWATATEINNMGFEILRSTDGVNFTQIGWRDGAGNSSSTLTYGFPDHQVVPNQLYYYRLKQIDFDGTPDLTYIVSAMIVKQNVFTIGEFIPNPSSDNSRITVITDKEKDLNVTVYNTLGQIITNADHHVVAGTNTLDFNFSLLADGTYYAIIKADNEMYSRKLILTK
ncbi:MAG TPA: T9SS type A sorting domain-containing protein [Chitinophagales bacterium]|nr:T9SS type A sorting domain-containing protein [Chitinophagales bacterium]